MGLERALLASALALVTLHQPVSAQVAEPDPVIYTITDCSMNRGSIVRNYRFFSETRHVSGSPYGWVTDLTGPNMNPELLKVDGPEVVNPGQVTRTLQISAASRLEGLVLRIRPIMNSYMQVGDPIASVPLEFTCPDPS